MPTDQHHGHGGSYVVNPETQERELVERTNLQEAITAHAEHKKPAKVKTSSKTAEE